MFLIDVFDVWYSIALRARKVFGAGKSLWYFGDMDSFRASCSFDFGEGEPKGEAKGKWREGREKGKGLVMRGKGLGRGGQRI
jgi:hypothetical protein